MRSGPPRSPTITRLPIADFEQLLSVGFSIRVNLRVRLITLRILICRRLFGLANGVDSEPKSRSRKPTGVRERDVRRRVTLNHYRQGMMGADTPWTRFRTGPRMAIAVVVDDRRAVDRDRPRERRRLCASV